jgi:hypothetical protein
LAAIGIGLGLHLGLWERTSGDIHTAVSTRETSTPHERPSDDTKPTTGAPGGEETAKQTEDRIEPGESAKETEDISRPPTTPVTINYEKFRSTTFRFLDHTWEIKAGHHFATETDPIWTYAWCYTQRSVKGVSVNVDLANRESPSAAPTGPIASRATLEQVGLTEAAALVLAAKCAWDDQKAYSVRDFRPPGGQRNPFESREPVVTASGRVLKYDGDIGDDFLATLKKHDFGELQIDSMGGLIIEAMSAGSWLRQSGKSVQVNRYCLSACVLVLAGGAIRAAAETAQIGVHRFYSTAAGDAAAATEWAQQTSSEIISFLERMDVKVALFHAMAAVPSESMEFIDQGRLRQWNLIGGTEITATPIPPEKKPDDNDGALAFAELDGFDAIGHDLVGMPLREVTLERCKTECSSNPKCRALTYNKKAAACFLKNSASVILRNETAFAAYERQLAKRVRVSDLTFYRDTELAGKSYRRETPLGYAACILLCDRDARCIGFNFDHGQRACTLLNNASRRKPNPLISSGTKLVAN